MAKTNRKEGEYSADYWVQYVEDKFKEAKNYRSTRVEKQWMINYAFYKGWQNLKYNTHTQRLVFDESDPLKFYVNMVYTTVRAIRAAVTKDQPIWDVDARPYGSMTQGETRALSAYLDTLYEKLDVKYKTKELVMYGLLYGAGIFQYGFDADADEGEGEVWVETLDPFDVYIDPVATGMDDARHIIKVVRKSVEDLQKNPRYQNTDGLGADNKLSESPYKEMIARRENNAYGEAPNTILLYEAWCKTDDGIRVITTAGGRLLRNEVTSFKNLPFLVYQPDINPNEVYGEGWVKNLVPINRAVNALERSNLEYHTLFAKGKYITDAESGIKTITNENGQIIRKPRGSNLEVMDMKPMSASVFKQIESLNRYAQDVGAAHEAFLGRTPTGVTAAIAFETLVANAMNNLVDLLDNLEITLSELGEELLKLGREFYTTSKSFKMQMGDMDEVMSVVGMGAEDMLGYANVIPLPERPEVRVRITSGIAHTRAARQETLIGLRGAGDISRRTLLEELDFDPEEEQRRLQEEMMPPQDPMAGLPADLPLPEGEPIL